MTLMPLLDYMDTMVVHSENVFGNITGFWKKRFWLIRFKTKCPILIKIIVKSKNLEQQSSSSDYTPTSPKKQKEEISFEQKKKALEYYRSGLGGTRSLKKIQHRFRWFKEHHQRMLTR